MKRKIYEKLLEWKQKSAGKTALLMDGARRVGKSWIGCVSPAVYGSAACDKKFQQKCVTMPQTDYVLGEFPDEQPFARVTLLEDPDTLLADEAISSNGIVHVANEYDYRGRRIKKTTQTIETTFVYDGWNLVYERCKREAQAESSRRANEAHENWFRDNGFNLRIRR